MALTNRDRTAISNFVGAVLQCVERALTLELEKHPTNEKLLAHGKKVTDEINDLLKNKMVVS